VKDLLDKACLAYYQDGDPILTDAQFDRLAELHNYHDVGYTPTDGLRHTQQMYSLQKCFDILKPPFHVLGRNVVCSPKLDGAAVALTYVNGSLFQALTRGDGIHGKYVLDKMQHRVPATISLGGIVQITGELVAPDSIENARNYAAGSLNLKDPEEFKTRQTIFYAYGLEDDGDFIASHMDDAEEGDTWTDRMRYLASQDFATVNTHMTKGLPTDGLVYRINDTYDFNTMGHTAKHPRGAFALKEQQEGVVTKLLDVKWQVGKSGVVSPVAILEPVMVGDAKVSRATLHNMDYIRDLDLELGCDVEIIRSGEIIPRVVRRV